MDLAGGAGSTATLLALFRTVAPPAPAGAGCRRSPSRPPQPWSSPGLRPPERRLVHLHSRRQPARDRRLGGLHGGGRVWARGVAPARDRLVGRPVPSLGRGRAPAAQADLLVRVPPRGRRTVAGFTYDSNVLVQVAIALLIPLLPGTICVAILRYRLYDVDLLISRTVAWAALTVLVAASWGTTALVLGGILGRGSAWASAGATLAAAAGVPPASPAGAGDGRSRVPPGAARDPGAHRHLPGRAARGTGLGGRPAAAAPRRAGGPRARARPAAPGPVADGR